MNVDLSPAFGLPGNVSRPLVLAADSSQDNLLLLVYALNLFGYSCMSTLTGEMVLQLAKGYKPDIILLDMIFPDLSGVEVIKRLKQDAATQSIAIVAVTASSIPEDRDWLLKLGCQEVLNKPYNLDDLEIMLRLHLSQMPFAS
jgi:two-component system, cell cycle response regulator DivK